MLWQTDPLAYEEVQRFPLGNLDGALLYDVSVRRLGLPTVLNSAFFVRRRRAWGDPADKRPVGADRAYLWDASPLMAAGRTPPAEHLFTGDDPYVTEGLRLAAAEGRRFVLWLLNWGTDDTGVKAFSQVGGRELRLGYHWSDSLRVRAWPRARWTWALAGSCARRRACSACTR